MFCSTVCTDVLLKSCFIIPYKRSQVRPIGKWSCIDINIGNFQGDRGVGGHKRRNLPDGDTPGKPRIKQRNVLNNSSGARKTLFGDGDLLVNPPKQQCPWTEKETATLVQYGPG